MSYKLNAYKIKDPKIRKMLEQGERIRKAAKNRVPKAMGYSVRAKSGAVATMADLRRLQEQNKLLKATLASAKKNTRRSMTQSGGAIRSLAPLANLVAGYNLEAAPAAVKAAKKKTRRKTAKAKSVSPVRRKASKKRKTAKVASPVKRKASKKRKTAKVASPVKRKASKKKGSSGRKPMSAAAKKAWGAKMKAARLRKSKGQRKSRYATPDRDSEGRPLDVYREDRSPADMKKAARFMAKQAKGRR